MPFEYEEPSVNIAVLMGTVEDDPVMRETASGVSVCNFKMSVTRTWWDSDEKRMETDHIPVTAWKNQATNCKENLQKGSVVCVHGTIQNNKYGHVEVVAKRVICEPFRD